MALSLSAALIPTRPQQDAPDRCVGNGEMQTSAPCTAARAYTPATNVDLSSLWQHSLKQTNDSVPDSTAVLPAIGDSTAVDSASLDPSLLRAIRAFDQGLDIDSAMRDTLPHDSVKERKPGIDSPVKYEAKDSMTYDAATGFAYLFGESKVQYQGMELNAAKMSMNIDSSMVYADAHRDTTGTLSGKPLYKQGSEQYESESMAFNFKTKKGFISNVSTTQGNGFLTSREGKRADDGTLYLQHATYTPATPSIPTSASNSRAPRSFPARRVSSAPPICLWRMCPCRCSCPSDSSG